MIMHCPFCGSERLKAFSLGDYHAKSPSYGPFDTFECQDCRASMVLPPPSVERLRAFYSSHSFGMSPQTHQLLTENPEAAWHKDFAERIARLCGRHADESFSWLDLGAGGGELSVLMERRFPLAKGVAVDIHPRPPRLAQSATDWIKLDLSEETFSSGFERKFDLVFAIGVWEHARSPDVFARQALALLAPGGTLYLETPNWDCVARRLLGRRWPYFMVGEHIGNPSPLGARICMARQCEDLGAHWGGAEVSARAIPITYGFRYALAKLGLTGLSRLVPSSWAAPFPAGAMETVVKLRTPS